MKRREFLAGALIPAAAAQNPPEKPQPARRIYLDEYQPKSALVIAEHRVPRARFPLIDVHTHVSQIFGAQIFGAGAQSAPPPADPKAAAERVSQIVRAMDQLSIQMLLNLLRERITEGPLVKIDDPRFDPMWEAAGNLNLLKLSGLFVGIIPICVLRV